MKGFIEFEGPAFLEVMIDQDACVYPMIGPGLSYKDMATGDYIARRRVSAHREEGEVDMTKIPDLF